MALADLVILAQRTSDSQRLSQTLLWLGILAMAVLVGGIILMVLRKRLDQSETGPETPPFTLSDLRRLHREGQLSDAEYERAKQQIIALSTGGVDSESPEGALGEEENDNFGTSRDDPADSDDKPR
jgi:hypothetical protein